MSEVSRFLSELDFQGSLLREAEFAVREVSLDKFKTFIIERDGCFRTNLELLRGFKQHLIKTERCTKRKFVNLMSVADTKKAFSSLLFSECNTLVENKILIILKKGLTEEDLYDKLLEYCFDYSPILSLKIIEQTI